jgi:hypothetical protein
MASDRTIRIALWASVVLNLLGLVVFVPAAIGLPAPMLPLPAPRFYAAQVSLMIGTFGGAYLWMAMQPRIHRPLVVMGGVGKLGFFAIAVIYRLAGDLPSAAVSQALPDLFLAMIFLTWARAASVGERAAAAI